MFGTDMDTLVRGSAENPCSEDTTGYDAHYNSFTKAICAGMAMIISAVTLFLLMNGFGGYLRYSSYDFYIQRDNA